MKYQKATTKYRTAIQTELTLLKLDSKFAANHGLSEEVIESRWQALYEKANADGKVRLDSEVVSEMVTVVRFEARQFGIYVNVAY